MSTGYSLFQLWLEFSSQLILLFIQLPHNISLYISQREMSIQPNLYQNMINYERLFKHSQKSQKNSKNIFSLFYAS